ncbi:MAG: hypothetical protein IBX55_12760 [Methyloprofundus sp.]|nr:hypothetical protein [Methyloprofundus sp.]
MSNLLIVESDNDRYFLEALIFHLNMDVDVDYPICDVDEFECLEGLNEAKLKLKLDNIKFDKYDKVGILVDADAEGVSNRVALVKKVLTQAGVNNPPNQANMLVNCPNLDVDFAIGVINVDGNGELETLLKGIKAKDSTYADCLDSWRTCLEGMGKTVTQKDFDKFWLNNYFRYDTCSSSDMRQASRKCSKEAAFKKQGVWDFENELLDELKKFLNLFN